ncbi:hypothetical protein T439DRAFT_329377 [Meredithblackwellia eburnea MCA 4105]
MLPKVAFINAPTAVSDERLEEIKKLCEIVNIEQGTHDEMIPVFAKAVKEQGPFVAVIAFLKWDQPIPWPLDEALASSLTETGCKFWSYPGAGFDNIDVKYLTSKQVYYANNPECVAVRTADTAAMMILQALRATSYNEDRCRKGLWKDNAFAAKDARSSTLGIIGFGKIGKIVSDHMQHFGMKVIYNKRTKLSPEEENGASFASLDDVLANCDVLSLHCPLQEDTRHLIGAKEFAKMKQGAVLVNTSRGPVVDEEALVDALKSGKISGCALDVFEQEPKIHEYLMSSPKAILSPHNAVINNTVLLDAELELLNNLETFLKTGVPASPVNSF